MDGLILTRARFRRRYAADMPEATVPSQFLEEVPHHLLEDIGGGSRPRSTFRDDYAAVRDTHYSYEDEDQSRSGYRSPRAPARTRSKSTAPMNSYNSVDNIAEFFASRGKKFSAPKVPVPEPTGKQGFRPGQKVRHPKYGEGIVYQREGDGENARITVQFPRFGLKKLVEKYAQLEKA
jgi:DNA helicase-2/ATP-dependent DNA helicase PcrA